MVNISWFIRRLRAMSVPEVAWRVSQKALQSQEEKKFKNGKISIVQDLFNDELNNLYLDVSRMHLNFENTDYSLQTSIPLLGEYSYREYKKRWNAGFQTEKEWPEQFSYSLEYKQRDDIGDARTNWELNRHFQFALLAKNYMASGDTKFLAEFKDLFEDWNKSNPFLWGISWTSVMEVAIRCSNWCYAWCFLKEAKVSSELLDQLRIGILNMTDYIAKHYSRYSSANNHLIVEAYAIGQTGILCDYKPWINLAIDILSRELFLQNYSDGINKELSLHYQSFYMEAMGLMMRLLKDNSIPVPRTWISMLEKMCTYVADCMGEYGETVVFGDDDGGKILDLQGGLNHYQYVLGLFSFLLDKQYVNLKTLKCENLNWLFDTQDRKKAESKIQYKSPYIACYKEGGNTILRSKDHKIMIGIDHAALGFGSIAAHGHADALSFQMYIEGQPIFVDPGTYIYHCDLNARNEYRRTRNHNTVCVDGRDQSEMLGAFLWGQRAKCRLVSWQEKENSIELIASQDGYFPVIHTRKFKYDGQAELEITDVLENVNTAETTQINFTLAPGTQIQVIENEVYITKDHINIRMLFESQDAVIKVRETGYSSDYGKQELTNGIVLIAPTGNAITKITWERI